MALGFPHPDPPLCAGAVRGRAIATLLHPAEEDFFVLKPKHSGFFATALEVLLTYLQTTTLILTGLTGEMCVLFTAALDLEGLTRQARSA